MKEKKIALSLTFFFCFHSLITNTELRVEIKELRIFWNRNIKLDLQYKLKHIARNELNPSGIGFLPGFDNVNFCNCEFLI